jgi:hypothetical protein
VLAKVIKTANDVLLVTPPPGKWTATDAADAIRFVESLIQPGCSYVFVADATLMTDYETETRLLWQAFFRKRGKQLASLWIVGRTIHPVVRMGIATASTVLRLPFRFVATLAEVPELARYAAPTHVARS